MKWTVPVIWEDGECFIIGGGPSVPRQFGVPEEVISEVTSGKSPPSFYSPFLEPIHNKHVIGINNAYLLGDWLDCVFFGDKAWYLENRLKLAQWCNLKVSCSPYFGNLPKKKMDGIKYLERDAKKRTGISSHRQKVAWNNNSGAAAISLAVHFGVKRILLLGFDMNMNTSTHWHKGYGFSPPFRRHLLGFSTIANDAKKIGVEIINVSPGSSITVFPKVSLKEIL